MTAPEREALALTDRQLFDIAHPMMNGGSFNNSAAAVEYGRRVLRAAGLSAPAVTVTEEMVEELRTISGAASSAEWHNNYTLAKKTWREFDEKLDAIKAALKSTTPQTGSQE